MFLPRPAVAALAAALLPAAAHALIVAPGTASGTAPADDFGFANVGRVYGPADNFFASGIYLGSGWMLSAYHVVRDAAGTGFAFGTVVLDGVNYSAAPGSGVRLRNADNSFADVALFQLTTVPLGLGSLTISTGTPNGGSAVVLAGNGFDGQGAEVHWNVNPTTNPDTWTETNGAGAHQGFYWSGTEAERWGTNQLVGTGPLTTSLLDDGFGVSTVVRTNFSSGIAGEAQGAAGDSGGGVFYKNGSTWELLGTIITTDRYDGQPTSYPGLSSIPTDSAVYGNQTYAVNLPTYRSQIVATIPEPSSAALLLAGAALAFARRRR